MEPWSSSDWVQLQKGFRGNLEGGNRPPPGNLSGFDIKGRRTRGNLIGFDIKGRRTPGNLRGAERQETWGAQNAIKT